MRRFPVLLGCLFLPPACLAQAWTQITTAASPPGRDGHVMAYDVHRQRVVMFGGLPGPLRDTWEFDGRNWIQMTPATSPPARSIAGMVYDSTRRRTVLFGGTPASGTRYNDTWEWDGQNWTQIQTPNAPSVRGGHNMAFNAITGRTVLHGGTTTGACSLILAGTWEYDGKDWKQIAVASEPPARARYGMAPHGPLQRTVVFGGLQVGACTRLNDTWVWDTLQGTWTQQSPKTLPAIRGYHTMAYDSARRTTVLFGGAGFQDTWAWDGTDWKQLVTSSAPSARTHPVMVYDSVRQRMVLFGGSRLNDTWELTWPTLSASPSTLSVATGGRHSFVLDAGTQHANRLYLVLGSVSGTVPGLNLGSVNLPLNLDGYMDVTLAFVNTALFPNTMGVLDTSGKGAAAFNVPMLTASSIGLKFYHAYLAFDPPLQFQMASNPVTLTMTQ